MPVQQFRITILCENSVGIPFGVIGEHGFACFIETEKGKYLFDTGQGQGIIQNAMVLNKDFRIIKAMIISHGHYDHTGGMPAVLKLRGRVPVYGHPDIFTLRHYEAMGMKRDIGIPFRREFLESLGADFQLDREMTEVGPGIFHTGEIPRKTSFEKGDPKMAATLRDGQILRPDPINDDLSLVVDTEKGLILILGCAHAGMVNIINHVIAKTGKDRLYAVIGGTHLGFSGEEQFEETVKALDQYKIEKLGVSHCTGLPMASRLQAHFGERFFFGSVGAVLES